MTKKKLNTSRHLYFPHITIVKMLVITDTLIAPIIQILMTLSYLIFIKIVNNIIETYNQEFNILLVIIIICCLLFVPVYITKKFTDSIESNNSMKH